MDWTLEIQIPGRGIGYLKIQIAHEGIRNLKIQIPGGGIGNLKGQRSKSECFVVKTQFGKGWKDYRRWGEIISFQRKKNHLSASPHLSPLPERKIEISI